MLLNGRAAIAQCAGRRANTTGEIEMNQDRFAGIWKQLKGQLKVRWGRLCKKPLLVASGARDQLAGKIQERYGASKARVARQLKDFLDRNRGRDISNR
jgi:uncharacterized protein YjbJ (UPF0337 family)